MVNTYAVQSGGCRFECLWDFGFFLKGAHYEVDYSGKKNSLSWTAMHIDFVMCKNARYRASKRKYEFFLKKTKWLGHEIDETGTIPNTEKLKAILELKYPENQKQLKLFLGAIQYLAKFIPRLSERTEIPRKLPKKVSKWNTEKNKTKTSMT